MNRIVAAIAVITAFGLAPLRGGLEAQRSSQPAGAAFAQQELLIKFRANATDNDKRDARGWVNAQRKELIRGGGGELELASLPAGIPVEVAVQLVSRHAAVEFAEPNWVYTHEEVSNDPYYTSGALWGMHGDTMSTANPFGSQADEAWAAGYTGSKSVYVAVIDEGINFAHPDLAANIWSNPYDVAGNLIDDDGNGYIDDVHGWDFAQNNNTIFDGNSNSGVDAHGTHVSGTIGGVSNLEGVVGVNWNVTIISAKFLGINGGTTANAIKAVDYVTDLKTRHGLNIVATNNSWGGGGYSLGLHQAIIRAARANILFVAAAGNGNGLNNDLVANYPSNYNTSVAAGTEPSAGYDSVIAVAAIGNAGSIASFSNLGATTVDLGAPGVGIWSTTPNNGGYSSYSGTSMATPHVTGAAALYLSTHSGASAAAIKAAILASATPTGSLAGITVTGGRLNVGSLMSAGGSPPSCDATAAPALSAVAGAGQVSLNWTAVSGAASYNVKRSTTNGGPYGTAVYSGTATNYVDSAVTSGVTYYYVATAVASCGTESGNSSQASATPTSAAVPSAPTGVNAVAGPGAKKLIVSWNSANGATSYIVKRSGNSAGPFTAVASGVTTTSYQDNGLKSGTYYYVVAGSNAAGTGPDSAPSSGASAR